MPHAASYAALSATTPLEPFTIERREPGPLDVRIDIAYCGVCHSDIHQARDEWGGSRFPMVPGHEITGTVTAVGEGVKRFAVGDRVGVGVMCASCGVCEPCRKGLEQFCQGKSSMTYNGVEPDGVTPTYGGYSTSIVVTERFVLRIPDSVPLDAGAPLLCAGITLYSPLRHWGAGPGMRVGIVGLGGLGHLGVKIAAALGAEVALFTHSAAKAEDARRMGASDVIVSNDGAAMKSVRNSFDLIISTVSAPMDLSPYLDALRYDSTLVLVGLPDTMPTLPMWSLLGARRSIAGSPIGGIPETQEMLDFCGQNGITADIELVDGPGLNDMWERVTRSQVRYRGVLDASTLRAV
jgi:uncharacterized zinc-type alcohol dehydrogenase-like protein